mmetsp:Transcript_14137/g.57508  ORF Transcript_14137/g.57508 Transcript_14137/m.57508 type:complete len:414 (+) Transcript_14137:25-1266(+)
MLSWFMTFSGQRMLRLHLRAYAFYEPHNLLLLLGDHRFVLGGGNLLQSFAQLREVRRHLFITDHRALRANQCLDALLRDAHAESRCKELPRLVPRHDLLNGALVQHYAGSIVQRGEVRRQLFERRHQFLLELLLRAVVVAHVLHLGQGPLHHLDQIRAAELDVNNTLGFEDATLAALRRVELHLLRVDAGVNNHPRTASEFAIRGDVHEDGLLVLPQGVDDVGAVLENLPVHIPQTAGEPAPVGEDDQRETLAIHVPDGLSRLERTVGEPNLTRLRLLRDLSSLKRRIRGDSLLARARLNRDGADGEPSEACPARDHAPAPVHHHLHERPTVEEVLKHLPRIVRRIRGGEPNGPMDGVEPVALRQGERQRRALLRRDKGQPSQDVAHAAHIVRHHHVRNAVVRHHFWTANLRI